MTGNSLWISVMIALISGLIGALITQFAVNHREERRFRIDTVKRFAANRYDLTGNEFSRALNEIFIVFNDYPVVMKSLSEFHEAIVSKQGAAAASNKLIILFKEMCHITDIKYEQFNDSFFLTPFNTVMASMQNLSSSK
ncbi:MAG: hypothetical protein JXA73_08895 [Acidobacteria bacterium]|nr:hypothetical protein [Acidobacteriota bacterium]